MKKGKKENTTTKNVIKSLNLHLRKSLDFRFNLKASILVLHQMAS